MKRSWMILVGIVLVFGMIACQKPKEEKAAVEEEAREKPEEMEEEKKEAVEEEAGEGQSEKISKMTGDAPTITKVALVKPDIAVGRALFYDVSLGTSGKSCNTCHEDGKDLNGVSAEYSDKGKLVKLINSCIKNPLKGQPLDADNMKMKNLLAYVSSL